MAKIDGRTIDHEALEHMRILAVRRVIEDGEAPSDVIKSFGLARTSIYRWLEKDEEAGWEGLVEKIAQGPEPKNLERKAATASEALDSGQGPAAIWIRLWALESKDRAGSHPGETGRGVRPDGGGAAVGRFGDHPAEAITPGPMSGIRKRSGAGSIRPIRCSSNGPEAQGQESFFWMKLDSSRTVRWGGPTD